MKLNNEAFKTLNEPANFDYRKLTINFRRERKSEYIYVFSYVVFMKIPV